MASMNTLGCAGISDYQSRTVTIDVAGVCQQSVLKTGNYQVRVPFSQMSQALQTINHQGGKVASVQLAGNAPVTAVNNDAKAEASAPDETTNSDKKSSRRKRR